MRAPAVAAPALTKRLWRHKFLKAYGLDFRRSTRADKEIVAALGGLHVRVRIGVAAPALTKRLWRAVLLNVSLQLLGRSTRADKEIVAETTHACANLWHYVAAPALTKRLWRAESTGQHAKPFTSQHPR